LEVTTPKLYVGNLSYDAAESDLFNLFSGVGNVKNAEIVTTKETDRSKGFGFVTMSTIEEAKRAVSELNEKEFMGRRMVVSGSRTTERGERADRADRVDDRAETAEGEAAA
jgi:RNA recognition motif-containing protein